MSMRETVKTALENDATLAGVLTGGVWSETEISRVETAGAFDANGEVLPCALVREETETPWGPLPTSSRLYLAIYLYQRRGYDRIDAAMERIFTLLHQQKLGQAHVWEITHADDVRDQQDQALDCSLGISRFVATRRR